MTRRQGALGARRILRVVVQHGACVVARADLYVQADSRHLFMGLAREPPPGRDSTRRRAGGRNV
ncbi:MAG TPA: hypothetical protein VEK07_05660 [Polyangiaceae bacterium]|nr:hypothetical protein [Polyangiaceae bacterium]